MEDLAAARGDSGVATAILVASRVADVPDFPKPGVLFKDLTPLFGDGNAFGQIIDAIVDHYAMAPPHAGALAGGDARRRIGDCGFDVVVGVEARGFVIAAALAYAAGVGVVPVRKGGKLPRVAFSASYQLEYGQATLEIGEGALIAGQRVLVVDDVLATGGTAEATLDLVERAGGSIAGFTVLMELAFLSGRDRLAEGRARTVDGVTLSGKVLAGPSAVAWAHPNRREKDPP